ncbi:unnamed protein product [Acanthoscelides obtectus]|uniref:UDP-glucuronosyltransferase n=2 Tax=Acanthoscelides obtectus TaxID=200917 RepID=A0A9P0NY91_ACAOB|nr:unnamed protein product [Acanthoscelides obtectus]CAK1633812.1 UDP-glucuronosyltransferase 2B2 [Acanthoscelides obtectus]
MSFDVYCNIILLVIIIHSKMLRVAFSLLLVNYLECANILVLQDTPSPSHTIWNSEVAKGLARRGHNVTMLGPDDFKNRKPVKNFHYIELEAIFMEGGDAEQAVEDAMDAPQWKYMLIYYEYEIAACKNTYNNKGMKTLLDYPDNFKFDAIVVDMTLSSCILPLIKRFKYPPTVGLTAFLFPHYLALDFGNTIEPAYIPTFGMGFGEDMSFFERLQNYFYLNMDLLIKKYYVRRTIQALANERFGESVGNLDDIRRHISMLLINVDMAFHYPQQLAPNIIPVGGLHVHRAGELPKDLKEIMDAGKKGVILFSLGTNVKSSHLKLEIKTALLKALGRLDQTVVWKFESNLTGVPENVLIRQWLPQTEILAHPNTKLFISHGGGLSTIESAYYGVPVLGIPFFGDQFSNLAMMENKGLARMIRYKSLTADLVFKNIREMLDNPIANVVAKLVLADRFYSLWIRY